MSQEKEVRSGRSLGCTRAGALGELSQVLFCRAGNETGVLDLVKDRRREDLQA